MRYVVCLLSEHKLHHEVAECAYTEEIMGGTGGILDGTTKGNESGTSISSGVIDEFVDTFACTPNQ